MENHTAKRALVIGATGGIGGEMARVLLARGWQVIALNRAPEKLKGERLKYTPAGLPGITWVKGDAMNPAEVRQAAEGVSLIVHGANPPGYKDWAKLARPMLQSSIEAARETGARLLFPGTVYNFAPETFPILRETTPQQPMTRKGRIRVEMEEMLRTASRADTTGKHVRSLIVRAGDYFGPRAGNNWFSQCLVTPGQKVRKVTYPGQSGIGHAWAYLPDVAETMMRLVEREAELSAFDVFHFAGHQLADDLAMTQAIRAATGDAGIRQASLFWPAFYLAAPFVTVCREMLEMRYLWQQEMRLDNTRLKSFLGEEPRTPLTQAVRETLIGLGCLTAENTQPAAVSAS